MRHKWSCPPFFLCGHAGQTHAPDVLQCRSIHLEHPDNLSLLPLTNCLPSTSPACHAACPLLPLSPLPLLNMFSASRARQWPEPTHASPLAPLTSLDECADAASMQLNSFAAKPPPTLPYDLAMANGQRMRSDLHASLVTPRALELHPDLLVASRMLPEPASPGCDLPQALLASST